jgi:uncharacterized protein (DUF433 family)
MSEIRVERSLLGLTSKKVEMDSARVGGVPVLKGTKYPVGKLLAELADGTTLADVCLKHNLDRDDCEAALEWAAGLLTSLKPLDGLHIISEAPTGREELRALVEEQAEDEGLWFETKSITEALLQQELRKLHAAVEKYLTEQS